MLIEMEEKIKKEDLIAKYSGKPFPPLQAPIGLESDEPNRYEGMAEYSRPGRNPRFRIIDGKGNSYGSGYAYLMGWMFTPPDILTIQTTTHVFTIEGKGLAEIERALMDEKVKELREYNPKLYTLPEEVKIVIKKIEITSRFELTD
jgi:hypothetical protein